MPRTTELSEEQTDYLIDNHEELPFTVLAKHIGVCVDTLKRILVRLELREFPGAKYAPTRKSIVQTWTRPCMDCGDERPRPKGHFFCGECRIERGYSDHE